MTLTLVQRSSWLNPYFVDDYELKNIHFFKADGIVLTIGRGWFGDNNRLGTLTLDLDYVLKRKPDYTLKTVFIIPVKRESYEKEGRNAKLYLPYDAFEWEIVEDGYKADSYRERCIYDIYKNLTIGFEVHQWTHNENIEENIKYLDAVIPLAKLIVGQNPSEYTLLSNRKEILTNIKKLAEAI